MTSYTTNLPRNKDLEGTLRATLAVSRESLVNSDDNFTRSHFLLGSCEGSGD